MSAITTMKRIIAPDGTPLTCQRSGAGPPLLLVHGTGADHSRWVDQLPALQGQFTIYTLDRRGRGGSGDAVAYASEREFEDVAAVVDAIGALACVLGHSFGALCAVEAARRTRNIRTLVLYEPPMPLLPGTPLAPREVIAALRARLAAGDRDGALDLFYREVARITPGEIALMRASPAWPARVAAAHTILRELQGVEDYTHCAS